MAIGKQRWLANEASKQAIRHAGKARYDQIPIDPNVGHGQASLKASRIPVHQIVLVLANIDTIDDLLEDFPSLKRGDPLASLDVPAHWQNNR